MTRGLGSGERELPMSETLDTGRFRQQLSLRTEGHWHLLAAAAGHAESIERCVQGLTAEALAAGTAGEADSPNVVWERVEALAAAAPKRLQDLAATWLRPDEIDHDPYDSVADFWSVAWRCSLIYLPPDSRPAPDELEAAPYMVQDEAAKLMPPSCPPLDSLGAIHEWLDGERRNVDDARRLDATPIELSTPLGRTEVEELLDAATSSNERAALLRLLVPRPHLLDASASKWIDARFTELWRDFDEDESRFTLDELLMLLGLRRNLGLPVFQPADAELLYTRIEAADDHEHVSIYAPMVYLLFGAPWHLPPAGESARD